MATTRASRVRCKSVSMKRAPISTARRNAAMVFSGACPEAPLCATTHTTMGSLQTFDFGLNQHPSCFAILAELVHCAANVKRIRILFANIVHQTKCKKNMDQQRIKKEISMKTRLFVAKGIFALALLAIGGFAIEGSAARGARNQAG